MATIKIIGWKENNVGYTGWDNHTYSELKKRLAKSINISTREVKNIAKAVKAKNCLEINGVNESKIESVTQILHTMGAEIDVIFKE